MSIFQPYEELGVAELREAGSAKWNDMLDSQGRPLRGAWIAEMDFATADEIKTALARYVSTGQFGYLCSFLKSEVKCALSERLATHHRWPVEIERIFLAPDVLSVLRAMIRIYTGPGDAVVVPTPCYMPFLNIPGWEARTLIEVSSQQDSEGRWEVDWVALEDAFARPEAKIAILCNPWNPTGRVWSESELERFGQLALAHGVRVFADEIHSPLVYSPQRHTSLAALSPEFAQITVTALAASKGWNVAGLKCAQAVVSAEESPRWREYCEAFALECPAPIGAIAAISAYREGEEWLRGALCYLEENANQVRSVALQECPGLSIPPLEGTYLQLWDTRALGLSSEQIEQAKKRADVGVLHGECMGRGYAGLVRFNIAAPRPHVLDMAHSLARALYAQAQN